MKSNRRLVLELVLACAPLLALTAQDSLATWGPNGVHLVRPAPPASSGIATIGSDGEGGTYIAWPEADTLGAIAFRIHRLTAAGDPPDGWTATGVRACALSNWTGAAGVIPDGAGGAYLYWDDPAGTSRVCRIGSGGAVAPGWPAAGIALDTATGQSGLVGADDGRGGVLLAWQRSASGETKEIVTQRFHANGSRASGFPAQGLLITSGGGSTTGSVKPRLLRDGDRGFWISYTRIGLDTLTFPSSYAVTHLDTSGRKTAGQAPNGRVLSLPAGEVGTLYPYAPVALALDGAGGAFAFTLGRNGVVRAFHLRSTLDEDPAWPAGGRVLASGAGWPSAHFPVDENWPAAAGDRLGSAYVGWRDEADFLLHASRVLLDGTIASGWTAPPIVGGEMSVSLVADGAGLFVASMVPRDCPHLSCTGPLLVTRMGPGGVVAPGWPTSNLPRTLAPGVSLGEGGPHNLARLVADESGGVVVAWLPYPEYYAFRFGPGGLTADVKPGTITGSAIRARFDPARGVCVTFALARAEDVRLELYDVSGRRLARERLDVSPGEVVIGGTQALPAGLYFARAVAASGGAVVRVAVAR